MGIFEHVFKIFEFVRIVAFESRIIRIGFFFLALCVDKSGSSSLAVFFPIRIASTLLLSLCTLFLSAFEESFESPVRVANFPSKVIAAPVSYTHLTLPTKA